MNCESLFLRYAIVVWSLARCSGRTNSERNAKHWKIFGSNDEKKWDELAKADDGRTRLKAVNFTWIVFDFDRTGT